eukprot:gb/GECG01013319.1/.p1 GENE.gb/GECG01013319.1/~~gb/GECG01013319.1/.p1  ORF type:complete len:533 (+),score=21.18 gb/GECG01013319.1/:1-1599(+)
MLLIRGRMAAENCDKAHEQLSERYEFLGRCANSPDRTIFPGDTTVYKGESYYEINVEIKTNTNESSAGVGASINVGSVWSVGGESTSNCQQDERRTTITLYRMQREYLPVPDYVKLDRDVVPVTGKYYHHGYRVAWLQLGCESWLDQDSALSYQLVDTNLAEWVKLHVCRRTRHQGGRSRSIAMIRGNVNLRWKKYGSLNDQTVDALVTSLDQTPLDSDGKFYCAPPSIYALPGYAEYGQLLEMCIDLRQGLQRAVSGHSRGLLDELRILEDPICHRTRLNSAFDRVVHSFALVVEKTVKSGVVMGTHDCMLRVNPRDLGQGNEHQKSVSVDPNNSLCLGQEGTCFQIKPQDCQGNSFTLCWGDSYLRSVWNNPRGAPRVRLARLGGDRKSHRPPECVLTPHEEDKGYFYLLFDGYGWRCSTGNYLELVLPTRQHCLSFYFYDVCLRSVGDKLPGWKKRLHETIVQKLTNVIHWLDCDAGPAVESRRYQQRRHEEDSLDNDSFNMLSFFCVSRFTPFDCVHRQEKICDYGPS